MAVRRKKSKSSSFGSFFSLPKILSGTTRRRKTPTGSLMRWTGGLLLTAFLGFLGLSSSERNIADVNDFMQDGSAQNAGGPETPGVELSSMVELAPLGRLPASVLATAPDPRKIPPRQAPYLNLCSFNIQFLGNSKKRENVALASMLSVFDIVLIQEMVAPPQSGTYPDGTRYNAGPATVDFAQAMERQGFAYIFSEEDTGAKIHQPGSTTEWWIVFYRPDIVSPAADLPGGFLASQRASHPIFQRVPYAFPFRTRSGTLDFVLIPVHLYPDAGPKNRAKRAAELAAVAEIVEKSSSPESRFLIVGDMNIQSIAEIHQTLPPGYVSLNAACVPTNTMRTAPFDHVVLRTDRNPQVDYDTGCVVIDLIAAMRPMWRDPSRSYPGDPYDHDAFRQYYSDHQPIAFRFRIP